MRRAFVLVFVAGVAALAVAAVVRDEHRAFTLGVTAGGPVAPLERGEGVCQTPIEVPRDGEFDTVRLQLGTYERPGPAVAVAVRSLDGRPLGTGTLAAGYPDIGEQQFQDVRVGTISDEQPVQVCVTNRGTRPVALYGNGGAASRATRATDRDGKPLDIDIALEFRRADASSPASLAPAIFDRAAMFRPAWVGSWTYWLLLALALTVVPALALVALRSTGRDAEPFGD